MNTPSHLLINAALRKASGRRDVPWPAVLWGAVAPDIPLGLLSAGFVVYQRWLAAQPAALGGAAFDALYFHNPSWIAAHNFLHSPAALSLYLVLLWRFRRRPGTRGHWWLWFVLGCVLHTTLDIPTHVTDGPLLFWPLDWVTRFHSPVSYWDPAHFGRQFFILEIGLDGLLLAYLFGSAWMTRLIKRWRT